MSALAEAVRQLSRPGDYDPLVERAAGARFVLFGEASHGGARRLPPLPGLDVAEHRRRRLPRLAAEVERRAAAERAQGRLLRPRPLQPAHLDERGRRVPRGSRSRGRAARTCPVLLLRPLSAPIRRSTRHRRAFRPRARARAIGVIYLPQTERQSHYFEASISRQFDAVIHLDETHAVEPLERTSSWDEGELPETYPWAV